ncbi:hypothetical protein DOY81_006367, partial [Sarcophaga bullata]
MITVPQQAEEEEQVEEEYEDKQAKGVVREEEEEAECVESKRQKCLAIEALDTAYDADVDDDVPAMHTTVTTGMTAIQSSEADDVMVMEKAQKVMDERQHIYELFKPWAMKTYGDQAKTKTITMRKKVRILKALEGKEHSRPDSSKFRFWVKTKGFTTKRPESFEDAPCTLREKKLLPPDAILSDNPADVDLYVASTNKDLEKRHYRKVAVVEEFFDIIYNIHMELGGRSGMHAGQKRTYRIISETYAFLPREAVTRFLSICPECKKNLRPSSPSAAAAAQAKEDLVGVAQNESSSEVEVLNYSSHTESSLEAGPTAKTLTKSLAPTVVGQPLKSQAKKRRYSNPDNNSKAFVAPLAEQTDMTQSLPRRNSSPIVPITTNTATSFTLPQLTTPMPKIRVNPNLQRPFTPPILESTGFVQPPHFSGCGFDFHALKSRDNLMRYYDFMRRLYTGNLLMPPEANLQAPTPVQAPIKKKDLGPVKKTFSKSCEITHSTSSSEDDGDNVTVLATKRFKNSPESSQKVATKASDATLSLQIPATDKEDFIQTTQIRAINLSKNSNSSTFSFTEKPGIEPKTPTSILKIPTTSFAATTPIGATSTPTSAIKKEAVTPPKSSTLRIPQMRSVPSLPPLDFERLKPITSTYLQLTRSMGLSDEEALRFDNLLQTQSV